MTVLVVGVHSEADSFSNSPGSSLSLLGTGLRDEDLLQGTHFPLFIVSVKKKQVNGKVPTATTKKKRQLPVTGKPP